MKTYTLIALEEESEQAFMEGGFDASRPLDSKEYVPADVARGLLEALKGCKHAAEIAKRYADLFGGNFENKAQFEAMFGAEMEKARTAIAAAEEA